MQHKSATQRLLNSSYPAGNKKEKHENNNKIQQVVSSES